MTTATRLTHEVLRTLTHLRRLSEPELPDGAMLEPSIFGALERMRAAAAREGMSQPDVDDATYAVAALVDEVVLSRGGSLREQWLGRLAQLRYFGENTAGEGFFQRLTELCRAPARTVVLEVFFLCLLFGFRGRYAVRGLEQPLEELIENVRAELGRRGVLDEPPLSIRPEHREEAFGRRAAGASFSWTAAGLVALSIALFAGLHIDLSLEAERALESLPRSAQTR
jgi:type VI secretion system protein ImpK